MSAQTEQIADEMGWEAVQGRLHEAQLQDAYKQATDAFELLREAKTTLNLVDINFALDSTLDQSDIDRVKSMVTQIDRFLAEQDPS